MTFVITFFPTLPHPGLPRRKTRQCEKKEIPEALLVQNQSITAGQLTCFNALSNITTGGGDTYFTVEPGAAVYLIAGEYINNLPYTHFQQGSYVHAYIDQTGEFCTNPKSIVAPVDEKVELEIIQVETNEKEMFFKVYPNPTPGQFTLELNELSEFSTMTVEIFSMLGEKVMGVELPERKQYLFDLSAKQTGLYLIRVVKGDKVGIEKLIKL